MRLLLLKPVYVNISYLVFQKSRLKTAILNVEGGEKDMRSQREAWRNDRVEEALMRLRVTHAMRAVAGYDDTAFSLDKQRLQLEAVSLYNSASALLTLLVL